MTSTRVQNPWREFIENVMKGSNYFRTSEYHELLADLDRLYALEARFGDMPAPQASKDKLAREDAWRSFANSEPAPTHKACFDAGWVTGKGYARRADETGCRSVEGLTGRAHRTLEVMPVHPVLGTPEQLTDDELKCAIAWETESSTYRALVELWERRGAPKTSLTASAPAAPSPPHNPMGSASSPDTAAGADSPLTISRPAQ